MLKTVGFNVQDYADVNSAFSLPIIAMYFQENIVFPAKEEKSDYNGYSISILFVVLTQFRHNESSTALSMIRFLK